MNKILLFSSALLFWTTPIWGQSTFHPQSMEDAADYSKDAGGATTLIMQDGKIIFEDYHNGADSLTVTHLFSGTKGFWSIMAAHALETGLISSYDERVASTITEWVSSPRHQGKGLITIKHLLELSSGLSNDVDQIQGTKPGAANIYQYVVDSVRLTSYPGNTFNYGPVNYYVFGVLLERKLASRGIFMNPLEYLDSIILSPIGFEYDSWVHDSSGNPHLPNGCFATSRNWIKYGQLLLQNGHWQGQQLVDSSLVHDLAVAEGPNAGHAKFLWTNKPNGHGAVVNQKAPDGSPGGFMYYDGFPEIIGVLGAGKNRMYIIPSLNAVVVRQTLKESDSYLDHDFLKLLFQNMLSSTLNIASHPQVNVFPNPTHSMVSISAGAQDHLQRIQVFNPLGAVVLETANDSSIDVSHLDPGTYVLRVGTLKGVANRKLIIR